MYNLRLLAALILSVHICLVQLTACAPHQPLSKQEESASLERLQKLKQELAAARDREAQVLDLLQTPRAADTSSLLVTLLRFRSDIPAHVTSHDADFSLGWR